MWFLLDNVQVNKQANGEGSITWIDIAAICRGQLLEVVLVPKGSVGGAGSTVTVGSVSSSMGN